MTVREILLPWDQQPQEAAQPAEWAKAAGLSYLWEMLQGSSSYVLRNVVDNSVAVFSDGNNLLVPATASRGIVGINSAGTDASALSYVAATHALSGCSELTLLAWFEFRSGSTSAQWLNFRTTNQHTLDIFSKTSNSLTWGADWAGAWNGASQQTLTGLTDGDFVCLGASLTSGGARFFANGAFSGTKSGSPFTTSSSSVSIVSGARQPIYGGAAFRGALPDSIMQQVTSCPWVVYGAKRILVPRNVAALSPTLLTASAINIGSTYATPRVTFSR